MEKIIRMLFVFMSLFLVVQSAWAMIEEEEEKGIFLEKAKPQQSKHKERNKGNLDDHSPQVSSEEKDIFVPISQNPLEIGQLLASDDAPQTNAVKLAKVLDPVDVLPVELLTNVSVFLEVRDLGKPPQLSKRWQIVASTPDLWRYIGLIRYGDYLEQEDLTKNPKQRVIQQFLSVLVNVKGNLNEIDQLVRKYSFFSYLDFLCHKVNLFFLGYSNLEFLINLIKNPQDFEELCAQGNEEACNRKISSLIGGRSKTYEKNPQAAIELNEILIKSGSSKAIERKLKGLKDGGRKFARPADPYKFDYSYHYNLGSISNLEANWASYGYMRNPAQLREFIEYLALIGNPEGIKEKLIGLKNAENGYDRNPQAARELNEELVKKHDPDAIHRKIWGLSEGDYEYDKDINMARELNESLVEKGDPRAIERKYEGLRFARYGYQRDMEAAKKFNDDLGEKGDQEAIERKIKGLIEGKTHFHAYDKDHQAARKLNEYLVAQNNQNAIDRKIHDLVSKQFRSDCIYELNPQVAVELNEELILRGNIRAIFRKILGTHRGEYGYKQDSQYTREFIKDLSTSSVPAARGIGRYLKVFALKYGVLGYERNHQAAIPFILEFNVPF